MTTTQKYAAPSGNLSETDTLAGLLRFSFNKFLQNTDDMLPAQVIAYDRDSNRASVQPLIAFVTTGNERIERARVASVPVLQLGGGGFLLSFPVKPGDLGWIKANDRDISLFLQAYGSTAPNTQRKHKFSDAMFIPDNMMRGVTLADADGVCLQNLDGTASVVLTDDGEVKISSATKVTFTGPEIDFISPNCNMNGVRFDTHEHTGVQVGAGKTGGPVNP